MSRHASVDGDVERIVGLVRSSGADAASRAAITAECLRAEAALDHFAPSPARDALLDLVRAEALRVA